MAGGRKSPGGGGFGVGDGQYEKRKERGVSEMWT